MTQQGLTWSRPLPTAARFPSRLLRGYAAFREQRLPHESSRYRVLAEAGQRPRTMIVGCCDSRAAPETIFDAAPGELFVVRNVANLAPPYQPDGHLHGVSAALEFGVKVLGVSRIVVMGHALCGGVAAMRTEAPACCADFVAPWVQQGVPAVRRACEAFPADVERASEEAVVRLSIENLRTFPWIAEREAAGRLRLTGLHFGIADGVLTALTAKPRFEPLD